MRITFEPQGVIGHGFEGMFLRSFEIICAGQSCFKTHLKACLMGLNLIPVEVENTKYLRNHSIDLPKILSMGWHIFQARAIKELQAISHYTFSHRTQIFESNSTN